MLLSPSSYTHPSGDLMVVFADHGVQFHLSELARGYEVRFVVWVGEQKAEYAEVDFLDPRAREFAAQSLSSRFPIDEPGWDWSAAFIYVVDALRNHFAGDNRLIEAEHIPYVESPPALIDPIIDNTINIWAGHGGSFKSIMSVMAAYQLVTGIRLLGTSSDVLMNALILDYEETDEQYFGARYQLLKNAYPRPKITGNLYYRNEFAPITTTAESIRKLCDEYDIGFLVIDPLINARGGAAESSSDTQAAMDAIRSLRRPVLIVDHLKQDDGKGHGQDRPFGSVFTRNLARSVWTMRRSEEDGIVEMVDRKANHRRQSEPIQYEVRWDKELIGVTNAMQGGWPLEDLTYVSKPFVNPLSYSSFEPLDNIPEIA